MSNYWIPKLKPMVEYCSIDDKIYFFGRPGVAVEIRDDKKFIATVCNLMNKKYNVAELNNHLSADYPNESKHLENLLSTLDNEYLLEDV